MLLFMDGCSHYSTSELGQKWTAVDSTNATFTVESAGRTDGNIKKVSTLNGNSGFLTFTPLYTQAGTWTPTATGAFGCALKVDDLTTLQSGGAALNSLISVYYGADPMFGCGLNPNGTITVYTLTYVGGVSIPMGVSVEAINDNEWAYIEFQWLIHATTGSLVIRSNGTTILNYTGRLYPDPYPFPPPAALWNSINVMGMPSVPGPPFATSRMCDVYLTDLASPNAGMLGDIQVAYIKPDGIGAQSNWTPSAGDNWECVDEVPPNGDTDYVVASAPGTRDTYTFENVIGDPIAIQICAYARKEDPSGASIAAITRQGGVDYDGVTQGIGSTSYDYLLQPQDVNPATSAQWTQAEMDAGEWGPLKVT